MTQLEEAKKAVEQICLRQNDCWYDTKTIAIAVYVILTHMVEADRKTENSSEKPNNCEDLQDWKDRMWAEAIVTEPTISKMEQVDKPQTDCNGCKFVGTYDTEFPCANCSRKTKDYYAKDEPQTD